MRPAERQTDTSLFQGDLAVNLFMVLLSVLATLTIVAAVVSSEGFRNDFRSEPEDPDRQLALSPGWRPVVPLQQRILVRSDGLYLFDPGAIGLGLATGSFPAEDRPGYVELLPLDKDPDPQSYRMIVWLGDAPVHPDLYTWHLTVEELPQDLSQPWPAEWEDTLALGTPLDIAVYPDTDRLAWSVAARLSEANIPFRLLFQRRETINFGRNTANFSFEATYK